MEITFVGNPQNILHTMSLPNISLADRSDISKLEQNKLKLYKNLTSIKFLKNCRKETSILPAIHEPRF